MLSDMPPMRPVHVGQLTRDDERQCAETQPNRAPEIQPNRAPHDNRQDQQDRAHLHPTVAGISTQQLLTALVPLIRLAHAEHFAGDKERQHAEI